MQKRQLGNSGLVLIGFATWTAPPYVALILLGASLTTLAIADWKMTK